MSGELRLWLRGEPAGCAGNDAGTMLATGATRQEDHGHLHTEDATVLAHQGGGLRDHFQGIYHFTGTFRHSND